MNLSSMPSTCYLERRGPVTLVVCGGLPMSCLTPTDCCAVPCRAVPLSIENNSDTKEIALCFGVCKRATRESVS